MIRNSIKRTIKRPKALFGADGAIMAAATLAAAGITTAATVAAAKTQAKAVEQNAQTQSSALKQTSQNQANLQKQQIELQKQQHKENMQLEKDAQMTAQLQAGKMNADNRAENQKMVVKYGGRKSTRNKLKKVNPNFTQGYQFEVTDGGIVVPIQQYNDGSVLYEAIGDDHNHKHKSKGKYKTGIGLKLDNGAELEVEGNQHSATGELILDDPNNRQILALSKHNIDGFNPRQAVMNGMSPKDAFAIQENKKNELGVDSEGNKAKCGTKRSLKRNKAAWGDYAGATYGAVGNVLGAGLNILGNQLAAGYMSKAYNKAGQLMSDAYDQMHGIDLSAISKENYSSPNVMAVVRAADTNINPQMAREQRTANAEKKAASKNIVSSAARNTLLAGVNDRSLQRINELEAYKHNEDEKIRQSNAERITQVATENANRSIQANRDYTNQMINVLQYNNDIENNKILGKAGALSDAATASANVRGNALMASMSSAANAITGTAQGFANSANAAQQRKMDTIANMSQLDDINKVQYSMQMHQAFGDKSSLQSVYDSLKGKEDEASKQHRLSIENYALTHRITLK